MGDGEIQEGQIWEAAMYAHQYKLNNLIGIVDWNKSRLMEQLMNVFLFWILQKSLELLVGMQ